MTLHSQLVIAYSLFTLCSHLDHVSTGLLTAEFTVTISDNSTVHSTKDCRLTLDVLRLYIMVDCILRAALCTVIRHFEWSVNWTE